jgi:hypothetical protein
VEARLLVEVIRDAGRTQVEAGTVTCCAIGPAADDRIDAVAGGAVAAVARPRPGRLRDLGGKLLPSAPFATKIAG